MRFILTASIVLLSCAPATVTKSFSRTTVLYRAKNCDTLISVTAPTTKVVGFYEPLPMLSPCGEALVAQQTPARVWVRNETL